MRGGDRDAVGEFVTRFGPRIRLRIRDKLGASLRRVYDSEDVLSTLSRRLDELVVSGRLRAQSEGQLWAVAFAITGNAICEYARVLKRIERAEEEGEREVAGRLRSEFEQAMTPEQHREAMDRTLALLPDETDQHVLWLWLNGQSHGAIAATLGMTPEAVRMRWSRIRARLRESSGEGG